jgi:hypothetical protein
MILTIFTSMIPPNNKQQLSDTLKELNTAIEEWDKITNKPEVAQGESKNKGELESRTKELLEHLRDQINNLSQD